MNKDARRDYMRAYQRVWRETQRAAAAAARDARHEIGDPVAWKPYAFMDGDYPGAVKELRGRVIAVNEAHRHYTAEAECNGYRLRESFKF